MSTAIGDLNWGSRRMANRAAIPETSVRRMIGELEAAGIAVSDWPLDKAMVALKAYRDGHSKHAIAALAGQPYLSSTSWLVSAGAEARVFGSLLRATAYIDENPGVTYHLSPVGVMGLDAAC